MISRKIRLFFGLFICLSWLALNAQPEYDLLIKGALIYDGSGAAAREGDVAIRGDKIVAIGKLKKGLAAKVVQARGLAICPGFIDVHSHADDPLLNDLSLRADVPALRMAHNMVMQGVTTVVVNQDGRSPLSIRAQRQQLERQGCGPNVILMVGHNTIRSIAMGHDYRRAATEMELERMKESLREGLEAGAFGMTAGLEYVPGRWSHPDELVSLAEVVAEAGGVYIAHERASGSGPMWYYPSMTAEQSPGSMIDNINELINVSAKTGVTTCITHIKARGKDYWGKSAQMIQLIEAARQQQIDIWADQYPYNTSGSDGQTVLLPPWAYDLAHNASEQDRQPLTYTSLLQRILADAERKTLLIKDIEYEIMRRGGAENIIVVEFPKAQYVQKSLAEVAKSLNLSAVEAVFWLQENGLQGQPGGATLRAFSLAEQDVINFMRQPWCMTASDGGLAMPNEGTIIHARFYGTFPRKIGHYARDLQVISVSQAIHSCTGMPAKFLGLTNRGLIKPGYQADVVLFDPQKIADKATFVQPQVYPTGVKYVWINGQSVVLKGKLTQAYPGQVLDHADSQRFK